MFHEHSTGTHTFFVSDLLQQEGLVAGFTTRQHRGSMDEPWRDDWSFRVPENKGFAEGHLELQRLLPAPFRMGLQQQVHSFEIATISANDPLPAGGGQVWTGTDGQIADVPGWLLVSQSADCCLALCATPNSGVIANFHAGWRGAVAGLPKKMVRTLCDNHGTKPAELRIALGPTIQQSSYQVGRDVFNAVDSWRLRLGGKQIDQFCPPDAESPGHYRFDLPGFVTAQLLSAGVLPEHLDACPLDTFSDPERFFSYRRDGAGYGLQAAFIGLLPESR